MLNHDVLINLKAILSVMTVWTNLFNYDPIVNLKVILLVKTSLDQFVEHLLK